MTTTEQITTRDGMHANIAPAPCRADIWVKDFTLYDSDKPLAFESDLDLRIEGSDLKADIEPMVAIVLDVDGGEFDQVSVHAPSTNDDFRTLVEARNQLDRVIERLAVVGKFL